MINKNTKLITSIGPATEKIENLEKLLSVGADVARINFSHGNALEHFEKLEYIKSVRANLAPNLSILLDTKGPEIRTHKFEGGEATITVGSKVKVFLKEEILGNSLQFSISYSNLNEDIKVGATILVDDGYLSLEVIEVKEEYILTEAKNTHVVADRRGINIPGGSISIDFLSDKDIEDIKFAAAGDFDYIALSFVQSAENVKKVRKLLKEFGNERIQIISKLESAGAVENFQEILHESDGIMVARGDLGVEVDPELVPLYQKKWIREANKMGKPAIVATQMLESMIYNPRPTRAEVSDVYNAVEDGTSAIMLSGESAKGKYWLESAEFMSKIARTSEENFDSQRFFNRIVRDGAFNKFSEIAKSLFKYTFTTHTDYIFLLNAPKEQVVAISRIKPKAKIIPLYTNPDDVTSWGIYWGVFAQQIPHEMSLKNEKEVLEYIHYNTSITKGYKFIIIEGEEIREYIKK